MARRASLAVSLSALVFYALRVCPTVMLAGDSPEIVTAGAVWGVPHAPGFPLYVTLTHLFMRVPLGEAAFRANMTSALYHAATVGVVGAIVARLTRSWVAVVAAGLLLALSPTFFLASLYAEVFPLNDLFFALILYLALRASDAARRAPEAAWPWLAALVSTSGLASAHQPIIALAAPAVLVIDGAPLASTLRARPWRVLALSVLFAVPYAASYALLVVAAHRAPPLSWGDVHDASSLARVILRADYGGPFRASRHASGSIDARLVHYAASLMTSGGFMVLLLAAPGVWLARKRHGVGLALAFAFSGPVFAAMNPLFAASGDAARAVAERFVPMGLVPLTVLSAVSVHAIDLAARRRTRSPFARAGLVLLWAAPLASNAITLDLGTHRLGAAYARDLVTRTEDGALVLVRGDIAVQAASYACVVLRACEKRVVLSPGELFIPWKHDQEERHHPEIDLTGVTSITHSHVLVARALAAGRPVYVMPDFVEKDPELARHRLIPDGLLLRVYASEAEAGLAGPAFLQRASAMAGGEPGEGWTTTKSQCVQPSFESPVIDAYVSARLNHARMAEEAFGRRDLANALREAARRQEE